MTDRITQTLCHELHARAARGLNKYGVTLADAGLSRLQLLQHAKEEALDQAAYLQSLICIEAEPDAADKHEPIRVRIRLASGDVVVRDVATVAEAVAELPWPLAVSWEVDAVVGAFW